MQKKLSPQLYVTYFTGDIKKVSEADRYIDVHIKQEITSKNNVYSIQQIKS